MQSVKYDSHEDSVAGCLTVIMLERKFDFKLPDLVHFCLSSDEAMQSVNHDMLLCKNTNIFFSYQKVFKNIS